MKNIKPTSILLILILAGLAAYYFLYVAKPEVQNARHQATGKNYFSDPVDNKNWPPKASAEFPKDVLFTDLQGQEVSLSKYAGRVLLIEFIGMTCSGCNAFAGGHKYGGVGNTKPQAGLKSLSEYVDQYSLGASLDDPRIQVVHIICYNLANQPPSLTDIKQWNQHFKLDGHEGAIVLAAPKQILGKETKNMIPGFMLLDKDLNIQFDATGSNQKDLYTGLLPLLGSLMAEVELL